MNTDGAPSFGFAHRYRHRPSSTRSQLVEGKWPPGPTRSLSTRPPRTSRATRSGTPSVVSATLKPVRSLDLVGLAQYGDVASIGSATFTVFSIPTAQVLLDRRGRTTTISVAGKEGVIQQALADEIKPILPPTAQVRTADAQAQERREGRLVHEVHPLLPALVRRRCAVRRRVRDLQHPLDHRRAARPRVRHDPHDRRLAEAVLWSVVLEAFVIGLVASVDRPVPRCWARRGTERALQRDQRRPADPGARLRAAHRVVSLLIGVGVTVDRRPHPGPSGDARPADRGGARRLEPPEVALLEVPYPSRDRGHGSRSRLRISLFKDKLDTAPRLISMAVGVLLLFVGVAMVSSRTVARSHRSSAGPRPASGEPLGGLLVATPGGIRSGRASTAAALDDRARARHARRASSDSGIRSSFIGAVDKIFVARLRDHGADNFSPILIDAADSAANGRASSCRQCPRRPEARVQRVAKENSVAPNPGQGSLRRRPPS